MWITMWKVMQKVNKKSELCTIYAQFVYNLVENNNSIYKSRTKKNRDKSKKMSIVV